MPEFQELDWLFEFNDRGTHSGNYLDKLNQLVTGFNTTIRAYNAQLLAETDAQAQQALAEQFRNEALTFRNQAEAIALENIQGTNLDLASCKVGGVNVALIDGLIANATNSNKLGNQLPAYYGKQSDIAALNAIVFSDDTALDEIQEIVNYIKLNRFDLDALSIPNIAGLASALSGKASSDLSYLDKGHWPTIANHTDTQHDIIFKAGKIIDSTAQVGINLVSSIVKRIDAAWVAGNGNGGLFSGSVAANTTYHCYVMIKDDGSVDAGFSISATASDIPNGYVAYRRIGSITVDHSANIRPFHQHGDTFLMKYQVYTLLSNSDDGAAQILDLRYVPKGLDNLVGKVSCFISSTDQTYGVVISSVFEGVLSASALNTPLYMYYSQAPCVATAEMEIALDSTTTIRKKGITAGSGHACRIVGKGWIDDRTQ
jgi:hypothetical protein